MYAAETQANGIGEGSGHQTSCRPAYLAAKPGDHAADFIWRNKGVLASGAALTAFLANPEPFLNGKRDLAQVATDGVVKPVVSGLVTLLCVLIGVIGCGALVYKYGLPTLTQLKRVFQLLKR